MPRRFTARQIWIAATVAVAILYPLLVELPFYRHVGILVLMWATLASAWNILGGYAGQISVGHGVFFGIGAYTSSYLYAQYHVNPWIGMFAGGLIAVVIALIIGYPSFRLQGHFFVMATIASAEIVRVVVSNWKAVGGAVGLYIPMTGDSWVNFQFVTKLPYYYIALVLLAGVLGVQVWLESSKMGFYFKAIKEDPEAARSLGIRITWYKLIAMGLSAFFTAITGTFYAQYILYIDPESVLGIWLSIQMCLVAILGGVGTVYGPILGSIVLVLLSESTRVFLGGGGKGLDLIVYGFLIIGVALFRPKGLYDLAAKLVPAGGRR